jgi:hypothetical protein
MVFLTFPFQESNPSNRDLRDGVRSAVRTKSSKNREVNSSELDNLESGFEPVSVEDPSRKWVKFTK